MRAKSSPAWAKMPLNLSAKLSAGKAKDAERLGKEWSEWQDLNLRPPRPERGALPDCATLRQLSSREAAL
jgi:hypothetical protein